MALNILAHEGSRYAGATRGVAADEVGININRFSVRYYPEVNEVIPNAVGNTLWRVVSINFSREVTCEGEVLSNTGIMVFTVAAALAFANNTGDFTPVGGTFYLDEATVTASRNGWLSVAIRASARATL